jgi:hypothetical protein
MRFALFLDFEPSALSLRLCAMRSALREFPLEEILGDVDVVFIGV